MSAKPLSTAEKVVDLISVSAVAMDKAAAEIAGHEKQAAAVKALIPAAVQALVENERIDPTEKEKAAAALLDPVKAIQILTKVAKHRNASEQATLGTGVPANGAAVKQGSANGNGARRSTIVGARSDALRESDERLYRGLGLAVPTN